MRVCVNRHSGSEEDRGGMTEEVKGRTETESTRTAFFPSGGAASPATCTTTPLSSRLYPLFLSSPLRSSSFSSTAAAAVVAAAVASTFSRSLAGARVTRF